jgi:hypothetical protein
LGVEVEFRKVAKEREQDGEMNGNMFPTAAMVGGWWLDRMEPETGDRGIGSSSDMRSGRRTSRGHNKLLRAEGWNAISVFSEKIEGKKNEKREKQKIFSL